MRRVRRNSPHETTTVVWSRPRSRGSRLNAAIDAGDYERIASELNYTHAAGRVARGLEFRSERREAIFVDAAYEDPREAGSSRSDA